MKVLLLLLLLAVSGFAQTATTYQATLSWSPNPANEIVTQYNIYRSTDQTTWAKVGTIPAAPAPAYTENIPAVGVRYYYYVTSSNTSTESDKSNIVSGLVPTQPKGLNLTVKTPIAGGSILGRWMNYNVEALGAEHMEILRDGESMVSCDLCQKMQSRLDAKEWTSGAHNITIIAKAGDTEARQNLTIYR